MKMKVFLSTVIVSSFKTCTGNVLSILYDVDRNAGLKDRTKYTFYSFQGTYMRRIGRAWEAESCRKVSVLSQIRLSAVSQEKYVLTFVITEAERIRRCWTPAWVSDEAGSLKFLGRLSENHCRVWARTEIAAARNCGPFVFSLHRRQKVWSVQDRSRISTAVRYSTVIWNTYPNSFRRLSTQIHQIWA